MRGTRLGLVRQARVGRERVSAARARPGVEALHAALVEVLETGYYPNRFEFFLEQSALKLAPLEPAPEDIELFSAELHRHQERADFARKTGAFLSALVKVARRDPITLHLVALARPLDRVGTENDRRLVVRGQLGRDAGYLMQGGSMRVEGSVGERCGLSMKGGSIHVTGAADDGLGTDLRGGELLVEKDVGIALGRSARGGTIRVRGDAGERAAWFNFGGTIVVEGDVGEGLATEMSAGLVEVAGNVGKGAATRMRGGTLRIGGRVASFGEPIHGGDAYVAGRQVLHGGRRAAGGL